VSLWRALGALEVDELEEGGPTAPMSQSFGESSSLIAVVSMITRSKGKGKVT